MIETIYKVEDSENKKPDINIRLPKNIKQIGQSEIDMNCQIYIEENVLAYIKQKPYRDSQVRYGVLLGEKKQGNGYTYVFINGMVEVDEVIEESIIFSDDVWTSIYDNIRRYYKEGMIVGWYASFDYDVTKDMLSIRKIHLDHFAGNYKVFLNINREEDDESFYIYERNGLRKQPCYHVYFEKSEDFEDYIFGTGRKETGLGEKESIGTKETGKYGIALNNNNNSGSVKDTAALGKISKEGGKLVNSSLGKVASFITIIALAGALAVMGQNGGLDALQGKVKGFVDGILHSEKDQGNEGKIIAVDGNPIEQGETTEVNQNNQVNAEPKSTAENATTQTTSLEDGSSTENESTSEEDSGMSASDEQAENDSQQLTSDNEASEETTTSKTSAEKNANEEQTTENVHATLSGANDTYASYTVKSRETLYSISMQFYGTADKIDEIMKINGMSDKNYVMEGQKILLP